MSSAADGRRKLCLRPQAVYQVAPTVRFVESFLDGTLLSPASPVSIPFLSGNVEFLPLVEETVLFSQKRMQLVIEWGWTAFDFGLLLPAFLPLPIDDCDALVEAAICEIEGCFFGQTFLLRNILKFLVDFSVLAARVSAKVSHLHQSASLIGASGSGKSFLFDCLAKSASLRSFFVFLRVDLCFENASSVALKLSSVCGENAGKIAVVWVENQQNARIVDEWSFEAKNHAQAALLLDRFARCHPSVFFWVSPEENQQRHFSRLFLLDWNSLDQASKLWMQLGYRWKSAFTEVDRLTVGFFPCDVAAAVFGLELQAAGDEALLRDPERIRRSVCARFPPRLLHAPFKAAPKSSFDAASVQALLPKTKALFSLLKGFAEAADLSSFPKGALLYGPSGCGKSFAVASFLSHLAQEFGTASFVVDGASVRSKFVGESEKTLRRIFLSARSHPRAVVVLDNFECLASCRRSSESRLLNCLLAEIDAAASFPVFVLGVGRDVSLLDAAVVRGGRLSLHFAFEALLCEQQREFFFSPALSKTPTALDAAERRSLICSTASFSLAELFGLLQKAALHALHRSQMNAECVFFADFLAQLS